MGGSYVPEQKTESEKGKMRTERKLSGGEVEMKTNLD